MPGPTPFAEPVHVTQSALPPLDRFVALLEGIWERRWLTNNGALLVELEATLTHALAAPHLAVATNGTLALMLAARALGLSGEVITTPFTFPATPHALVWCGLEPVFADVDPLTLTLDPAAVTRAVTPRTTAILGVHVYGMPCNVEGLQQVADRHGLKVIYDGAHAFGTRLEDRSVLEFGDATMLSFHATKLFHTAEGGAVATRHAEIDRRIRLLRNFGISNEVTVELAGINAKMTEMQAALGLLMLEELPGERLARQLVVDAYRTRLTAVDGITCFRVPPNVTDSLQYCVIRIEKARSGLDRNAMAAALNRYNVFPRRYFYPLCSDQAPYRHLTSSSATNLPVARAAADEMLCLPLYGTLGAEGAHRICDMIVEILKR